MRHVILVIVIVTLCFSKLVFGISADSCTPADVKIQNKNLILPGVEEAKMSKIYFFHNTSKKSLWIDHPIEGEASAKAGWSSFFQPGKWSAMLLNRKNFTISCAVIEPGKVNFQDCGKAITVCSLAKVKFDSKRKGSYWLAEDKTWEDLISALQKRGVWVPVDSTNPKDETQKPKDEPLNRKEETQKPKQGKKPHGKKGRRSNERSQINV